MWLYVGMVFIAGLLGLLVMLGGAQLDLKRVRGRSLAFVGRSAARQSGETDEHKTRSSSRCVQQCTFPPVVPYSHSP
jgi:hypothetical protein